MLQGKEPADGGVGSLSLHPHIHCIIPGGFVDRNGTWRLSKTDGKFLFPVKAMSKVYRAKYVALLRASEMEVEQLFIPTKLTPQMALKLTP